MDIPGSTGPIASRLLDEIGTTLELHKVRNEEGEEAYCLLLINSLIEPSANDFTGVWDVTEQGLQDAKHAMHIAESAVVMKEHINRRVYSKVVEVKPC